MATFDILEVALDQRLPLPQLLLAVERQISYAPVEVSFVFDAGGRLLLRKAGSRNTITYTEAELARLPNHYFTHNHPLGGPLSGTDVYFAHAHNLAQFRLVTQRETWILSRPLAGWNQEACAALFRTGATRYLRRFAQNGNEAQMIRADKQLARRLLTELSVPFGIELL